MNSAIEQMLKSYHAENIYDRKNAMKEIIQEIVDEIRKVASEKNLTAMISMNYAQAIVRVQFESPYLQEELLMQGANEGEKYEGE